MSEANRSIELKFCILYIFWGVKVDWDFRISDLVKNPDGTYTLTSVVNFD